MTPGTPGPAPPPSAIDGVARRYQGLLAVLQEGVLVQDADGRVLEANPAAEFLFAKPRPGRKPPLANRLVHGIRNRIARKPGPHPEPPRFYSWADPSVLARHRCH